MGIIQKLFSYVPDRLFKEVASAKGYINPEADNSFFKTARQLASGYVGISEPYKQCPWVYSSVNTISQNIAQVPFNIYKERSNGRQPQIIEENPLANLFMRPNPYMTGTTLREATFVFLGLFGEAFWILDRNNVAEVPKNIWCFSPSRFSPLINDKKELIGWLYKSGNEEIPLGSHEVIQFRYFNPYDDLRGLSPIQAAQMGVDQDYYASLYNKAFFENGATVNGFIEVQEELTDKAFGRLLESFNERHSGVTKAYKIGILEGGASFKETKLSQKDMDFIESKKINRDEIFAVYKTNEVVLGFFDAIKSYEGIRAAHRTFWQECLLPKIKYFEETLWALLFSKIDGGKYWGEFDLANVESLQADMKEKVDIAERLFKMGYPINDINRRFNLGFDNKPWGDEGFVAAGISSISVLLADKNKETPAKEPPPKEDTEEDSNEDKIFIDDNSQILLKSLDDLSSKIKMLSIENKQEEQLVEEEPVEYITTKEHEVILAEVLDIQIGLEKKCHSKVKRYFFEQRKRTLAQLYKVYSKSAYESKTVVKNSSDILFDFEKEVSSLKDSLSVIYTEGYLLGAKSVLEKEGKEIDETALIALATAFTTLRLSSIPSEIVETVHSKIKLTLFEGVTKSESVQQLATRIREVYNVTTKRALTIARTESSTAISFGRYEQMENLHIPKHMWVSAKDEKVRVTHRSLNGKIAEVGVPFPGSFLRFPGDPSAPLSEVINCRCITVPYEEE